jgi:hypothetical protein
LVLAADAEFSLEMFPVQAGKKLSVFVVFPFFGRMIGEGRFVFMVMS